MSKYNAICAVAAVFATAGLFAASAPASAEAMKAKVIQKNGETLYCVKETRVDSRIPTRTCLTKDQWAEREAKVAMTKGSNVLASNASFANQN